MRFFARIIELSFIVLLVTPLSVQAQSTTRGWVLGGHLFTASLDAENSATDNGGGLGLTAAYGFRNRLSLFFSAGVAGMNAGDEGASDYALGVADLGVRYTFRHNTARWRPFATAAISGVSAVWENIEFADLGRVDLEVSGAALTLGGGVQYFTSPRWALDGALLLSAGSFDHVKVENVTVELDEDKIDLTAFRIQFGARYYFKGGND